MNNSFKMRKEKVYKNRVKSLILGNITQRWVGVIKPFTMDYSIKLSATEIARISSLPQQSVSRILNLLSKMSLIEYSTIGKNKLFYFDFKKGTTYPLFLIVEGNRSVDFNLKHKREALIVNKILDNCDSIILFGSYASGKTKKNSDLDLVIIGNKSIKKFKELKSLSPIEIHEHFVSYKELKETFSKKNPLALEICKNHVLFGDFGRIIKMFFEVKNG